MKKIILCICLLQQIAFAQPSNLTKANAILVTDEIINHIKNQALVKDIVDWNALHKEIDAINPNLYHEDSLMIPYILTIYKYLRLSGDKHSFYMGPKATSNFKSPTTLFKMPTVILVDSNIALLKITPIVSFNQDVLKKYADTLRMQIEAIDNANSIKGWIVDLRHNTGGNMWPMIAGLNPIVEDAIAGYFIDAKGREDSWKSENKKPQSVGKLINNYKCKNLNTKIAILIDSMTGSSGEMTAISFLGLNNVKSFGQNSAGFTTANQTFPLSNGGVLLIATKYAADRNKKIYKDYITPDVITEYNETLNAAKDWLKK